MYLCQFSFTVHILFLLFPHTIPFLTFLPFSYDLTPTFLFVTSFLSSIGKTFLHFFLGFVSSFLFYLSIPFQSLAITFPALSSISLPSFPVPSLILPLYFPFHSHFLTFIPDVVLSPVLLSLNMYYLTCLSLSGHIYYIPCLPLSFPPSFPHRSLLSLVLPFP